MDKCEGSLTCSGAAFSTLALKCQLTDACLSVRTTCRTENDGWRIHEVVTLIVGGVIVFVVRVNGVE